MLLGILSHLAGGLMVILVICTLLLCGHLVAVLMGRLLTLAWVAATASSIRFSQWRGRKRD